MFWPQRNKIISINTVFNLDITQPFYFRLARKEEVASTVVQSLRILLAMKPGAIYHVSKQVSILQYNDRG